MKSPMKPGYMKPKTTNKKKKVIPHNILLPINRKSFRFLNAINKIRVFLDEDELTCIPGAKDQKTFMKLLFGTKYLKYKHINIKSKQITKLNKDNEEILEDRLSIKLNITEPKRRLLSDYLRTYKVYSENKEVLLPKSISNFILKGDYKKYYNNDKIPSLEYQINNNLFYSKDE